MEHREKDVDFVSAHMRIATGYNLAQWNGLQRLLLKTWESHNGSPSDSMSGVLMSVVKHAGSRNSTLLPPKYVTGSPTTLAEPTVVVVVAVIWHLHKSLADVQHVVCCIPSCSQPQACRKKQSHCPAETKSPTEDHSSTGRCSESTHCHVHQPLAFFGSEYPTQLHGSHAQSLNW